MITLKEKYRIGIICKKSATEKILYEFIVLFDAPFKLIHGGINTCTYKYLQETIRQLKLVCDGMDEELEWGGGEQTWFESHKDQTVVRDLLELNPNITISTKEVLELLELIIRTKFSYDKPKVSALAKEVVTKVNSSRTPEVSSNNSGLRTLWLSEHELFFGFQNLDCTLYTAEEFSNSLIPDPVRER